MIGIISDIHGNYTALSAVLRSLDSLDVKQIYCLGDVVGYYSQINECCDELRRREIKCVMGNHDWYLVAKSFCPRSKSVNDCLQYQNKIITAENREWLSSFPVFLKVNGISMVHGGWTNPVDEYLTDPQKEYFDKIGGLFFASGHVHRQSLYNFGEKKYCNPGSVGQPRDNDPRAAFATFDGKQFSLHRVEYNVTEVGKLMEKAGFNGYYYGCLKTGSKNLQWEENTNV